MDKLLTVEDVAGILRVSKRTAYVYMGQMQHLASPLRVTERALEDWIWERTKVPATPGGAKRQRTRMSMPVRPIDRIPRRKA